MAGISLLSGPQDPSQLDATINQIITTINGFLTGSSALTSAVANGTTSANLPSSGIVVLASTHASAAYTMSAPVQGNTVMLVNGSTQNYTIAGKFNKTHTKLTATSTSGAKIAQIAAILGGLSTSAWGVMAAAGVLKST